MKEEHLYTLYHEGLISNVDLHFARLMARLCGRPVQGLALAAALVSGFTRKGHICLDLSTLAGRQLLEEPSGEVSVVCPELSEWGRNLRESGVVGNPGEYRPLILDDRSRLYLRRYWDYQKTLADLIWKLVHEGVEDLHLDLLKEGLTRLFTDDRVSGVDWQKVAAFTALSKRFCVISGGPGTGKTATVAKILALLVEQAKSGKARVALAAPTGKAAVRLQEAIKEAKAKLNCSENVKEAVPEEASTLHRLLGSVPGSPYFRYNAKNRLPVDTVIVDEASMVDLPLLSKLTQALPAQARLILLGDKDQLASVEAGAVLGDICDTGHPHGFSKRFCTALEEITGYTIPAEPKEGDESGVQDCIVQLLKGYRFGSDSGIGAVSRAVNEGKADLALVYMMDSKYADIVWHELPKSDLLYRSVRDAFITGYGDCLRSGDPHEVLQSFDQFRILCALREGPFGVVAMNLLVEKILRKANLINPESKWYPGRPVLIARNDYKLQLFNGDVGIILPDPEAGNDLRAFFPAPEGELRKFHPLRLPEHETVYAMTVHKSQGSEFNHILLLLPDRDSPVLTRELIYTGITRAKEHVEILGNKNVFRNAVSRRIERTSGLRDALWLPKPLTS